MSDDDFANAYARIVWSGQSLTDIAKAIDDHNRRAAERWDKTNHIQPEPTRKGRKSTNDHLFSSRS